MCEICRMTPCSSSCPNAVEDTPNKRCAFCGEGIYNFEKYITNDADEHVHLSCLDTVGDVLDFLGVDIRSEL